MPSFFDNPVPWDPRTHEDNSGRRHTVDHGTLRTEPTSRAGSISSTKPHQSEPVRRSSANDAATEKRRSSSMASTSGSSTKSSGLKGLFGKSKGDKPKKDKKEQEKLVITSIHAAKVKTKLQLDPNYRRLSASKTAGEEGAHKITHSMAEEQEMRHPHSGPAAVHPVVGKTNGMSLSKITSGDEVDEEDELDKIRTHLMASRLSGTELGQVPEDGQLETHVIQEDESPGPSAEHLDTLDSPVTPTHSDQDSLVRHKGQRISMGGGWTRDESGKWSR